MAVIRRLLPILLILQTSLSYGEWHSASRNIMGTVISVELWTEQQELADSAIAAVFADMRAVESAMSPYIKTSELSRVNASAAIQPMPISAELYKVIQKSLYFSRQSGGAFDISFASVGQFYDYRKAVAPDQAQRDENLAAIDYRLIELNSKEQSIFFKHPKLKIDLGGIAKGYAVDRSIQLLLARGIRSAVVSAGGDSRIIGGRSADPDSSPWMIGIRHPRKDGEYAVRMPLIDTAISTSGDYERYYMEDGVRIHHILNPDTGKSAGEVQSVSVLAANSIDSDALSTTVFVLGIEKGLALINRMAGIDAIIIDSKGKLHYSEELLRAATE